MSLDPSIAAILDSLSSPAAFVDSAGRIVHVNEAFASWAPAYARGRLELRPEGAWIVSLGRTSLAVRAEPMAGGHLVISSGDAGRAALDAVVTSVVRRLDRVSVSLESALAGAIREHPAEAVTAAVREALATVEDLRALRRQVLGLSPGISQPEPTAVNLGSLTSEAVAAMTGPLPLEFGTLAADCVVRAVREKLFWAIAAIVGLLARGVGSRGVVTVAVSASEDAGRVVFTTPGATPVFGAELEGCRDAVDASGGSMLVDPQGAVILRFPIFVRPQSTDPPARGIVLVVDDDPSILSLMAAVLRREGYTVIEADNGVAAAAILRTRGRELAALVTDALLPGRSGRELVVEARRYLPGIPVLMVSGHDADIAGTGATAVLQKPFRPHELVERVGAIVSARTHR